MNIQGKGFPLDLGGSFTEDAPRPPVPGEEGELVSTDPRPVSHGFYSSKSDVVRNETSTATPRRSDLDLGYEPEGSASPTPPYLKWAESLHSLLDDQDGINLFRTFLKQEDCADLLDFWFACSGFRKLEPCASNEEKRLKLAKAIYKKYILDNNGIVSRQIKPATKSFIKDCVMKLQIDPDMFDQAQTEIQCMIEDNTYPLFLKSDIYLEYTRTGGESPKIYSDPSSGSGTGKGLPGYLPTLNEDEEWKCDQEAEPEASRDSAPSSRLTQKLLLETATQRAASARRYSEGREFRSVSAGAASLPRGTHCGHGGGGKPWGTLGGGERSGTGDRPRQYGRFGGVRSSGGRCRLFEGRLWLFLSNCPESSLQACSSPGEAAAGRGLEAGRAFWAVQSHRRSSGACRESSEPQFQAGRSPHQQKVSVQLQGRGRVQLVVERLCVNTPGNCWDEPQREAAGSLQEIPSPL